MLQTRISQDGKIPDNVAKCKGKPFGSFWPKRASFNKRTQKVRNRKIVREGRRRKREERERGEGEQTGARARSTTGAQRRRCGEPKQNTEKKGRKKEAKRNATQKITATCFQATVGQ